MRRLAAICAVAALLWAGPASAQGDEQQSTLAKIISQALSTPEGRVRIGAVEGPLSSDALIRDIEISDREGPWLRVDRARLIWRRAALLARRLEVDKLEIGRIDVLRQPVKALAAEKPAAGEPLLPDLPVKVVVTAFSVGEVVLAAPVMGSAARLGLSGALSLGAPAEGLQATASVKRLDRDGETALRLSFVPKGETLAVSLRHRESPGGLVAGLLDIPGRPAVELDAQGDGPLDAWRATLRFSAGEAANVSGGATIARQGPLRRFDLDLAGDIARLLPPIAAPVFGGAVSVKGRMDLGDDGGMVLHGLRLASDAAEASLTGTMGAGADRPLDMQIAARARPVAGQKNARLAALKTLALDVRVTGPAAGPTIDGRIDADVSRLEAFAADFGLPMRGGATLGARVSGAPMARNLDAEMTLAGRSLTFANPQLATFLGETATATGKASLRGDRLTLDGVTLKGRRVDARVAGVVETGAGGAAKGQVQLSGALDGKPLTGQGRFDARADGSLAVQDIAFSALGAKGAGAVTLAAGGLMTGALKADAPDLRAFAALAGLAARGAVSADIALSAPGGAQQAVVKARGRGLGGFGASVATLEAEATLHGDFARPTGAFRAKVTGVQHADAQKAGLPKLDVAASGKLAGDHAMIDATVRGGAPLTLHVTGAAPLSAAGRLALKVTGGADLALANARLAGGQRVSGRIAFDASVHGAAKAPLIAGAATLANGAFSDLTQGVKLTGIAGRIAGAGTALRIEGLTAATPGGGRIAVSGAVQADPARGFPADLRIKGENARLLDTEIVNFVAGLDLAVTGPLASAPTITGQVSVVSLDVAIPDKLPADAAPLANARHLSPPEQTRERLKLAARQAERKDRRKAGPAGAARLAVRIVAPSHIFVRGRGVDAELGGDIALSGSLSAPRASGAFELRRGQINMLTQRLEFSRGRLTFLGDLVPELDFTAATSAGGVTAKVSVTGRADAPAFALTSEPQLPPDEVLSRLMFERAVGALSPLQAVQLAQAVARLTGRGGPDFLDKTRQALGVDTLDVTAGKDGPTVGASRYITRNIRIGVKAGATPEQSGVTANVDLGRRIKLQGETGATGRATIGIGAEIEY